MCGQEEAVWDPSISTVTCPQSRTKGGRGRAFPWMGAPVQICCQLCKDYRPHRTRSVRTAFPVGPKANT